MRGGFKLTPSRGHKRSKRATTKGRGGKKMRGMVRGQKSR